MTDAAAALCTSVLRSVHTTIVSLLGRHAPRRGRLLDVGCWSGEATVEYATACDASRLYGLEVSEEQATRAEGRGIEVTRCNLEQPSLPWAVGEMNVVVCNQVLEHLKNIFAVMDEIARVLEPGGLFVASVPNLASLHSRIMLLLGLQPSMIRVFGPHVRSFAHGEFKAFLTAGGVFEIVAVKGVGFYPVPTSPLGNAIGGIWPAASHTPVIALRRTAASFSWHRCYAERAHATTM